MNPHHLSQSRQAECRKREAQDLAILDSLTPKQSANLSSIFADEKPMITDYARMLIARAAESRGDESASLRWQRRMKKEGKCIACGKPAALPCPRCVPCNEKAKERSRNLARTKAGTPLDAPVRTTKPKTY